MTRKIFGTDGIRGKANIAPMNSETALKLGRACAHVFRLSRRRHQILIGKDTRLSGYMLESALTSGICSMGVDVMLVGPLPTPGIAFMTRSLRADAGVVISASHNAFADNGIKFFSGNGFKLPDELEHKVEDLVFSGDIDHIRPTALEIGKAFRVDDADGRYIEFVKNTVPRECTLEGLKVVVDCANGASYKVSPRILHELGAEVVALHCSPDGRNINEGCGSVHPEVIMKAVRKHGAHVGITHDGDGDRVLLADERGRFVDGDRILAICALDLKERGALPGNGVVATVMSNFGLEKLLQEHDINLIRTPVGDRHVVEAMRSGGYSLGGEQSGHIVFLDHQTTGDGIVTALQVLATMKIRGLPLSRLAGRMKAYPQVLLNVETAARIPFERVPAVARAIREAERTISGSGRVLVRYSGTEAKVRIMVEGRQAKKISELAEKLAGTVRRHLGSAPGSPGKAGRVRGRKTS